MECGHTACLNCVVAVDAGKVAKCPCGEAQAMPRDGAAALPKDYVALMEGSVAVAPECFTCGGRATQACVKCKETFFCTVHAMQHATGRKHDMKDVVVGAAPAIVVTCPKDPGTRAACVREDTCMAHHAVLLCVCRRATCLQQHLSDHDFTTPSRDVWFHVRAAGVRASVS